MPYIYHQAQQGEHFVCSSPPPLLPLPFDERASSPLFYWTCKLPANPGCMSRIAIFKIHYRKRLSSVFDCIYVGD